MGFSRKTIGETEKIVPCHVLRSSDAFKKDGLGTCALFVVEKTGSVFPNAQDFRRIMFQLLAVGMIYVIMGNTFVQI